MSKKLWIVYSQLKSGPRIKRGEFFTRDKAEERKYKIERWYYDKNSRQDDTPRIFIETSG